MYINTLGRLYKHILVYVCISSPVLPSAAARPTKTSIRICTTRHQEILVQRFRDSVKFEGAAIFSANCHTRKVLDSAYMGRLFRMSLTYCTPAP